MNNLIPASDVVDCLRSYGIHRATGVPCGHLAGPWKLFEDAGDLMTAPSEGAALSVAAGWELAGQPGVVLCQNSGFGNLINPLTSLLLPYQIPVLVMMTLRGWPNSVHDEQQHAVMGESTISLLDAFDVPYGVLAHDNLVRLLSSAAQAYRERLPFFILVPMKMIGPASEGTSGSLEEKWRDAATRPAVVAALMKNLSDELLVSTTGYLSRQAYHESDRPGSFYMQGSMGHAAAIGAGLASVGGSRRVVVLDGDGSFLMHMGTAAMIGARGCESLVHIVVDNGCYESTGCQSTVSQSVEFSAIGRGLGYRTIVSACEARALSDTIADALVAPGPVLCVLRVVPTPSEVHPRASSSSTLDNIARSFSTVARGS